MFCINLNIVEYKDVCSLYFSFISLSINLNIVEYKDSKYGYQDEKIVGLSINLNIVEYKDKNLYYSNILGNVLI